jgi:hypothetical protein|tara:strand:+ start:15 stop:362 length:348 start_codon:yes stop_codon:yes gene_type:complete
MAITPQSAKAKGRKLQQWVRDKLYSSFKQLKDGDIRSTSMGANGEDILFSPAARKLFPYSVECKSNAKNAIYKVMDQASENCPKGATPLAIIKADRQKPLAVVDAEHFFKLTKRK